MKLTALQLSVVTSLGAAAVAPLAAAAPHFDEATAAGMTHSGETYGASWGEMNGDLYPDLQVSNHRTPNSFYRNNGDGTFTDVRAAVDGSGLWTSKPYQDTHGAAWGDYDNNGTEELYIANSSGFPGRMLVSRGGVYYDQAGTLGIGDGGAARTPLWFDFSGDGKLDLGITVLNSTRLYQQYGSRFYNVTSSARMNCAHTDNPQLSDLDGDGVMELICSKDIWPKVVYKTTTFPFTDITSQFPKIPRAADTAIADFDGDLKPDVIGVAGQYQPTDAALVDASSLEAHLGAQKNKEKGVSFSTGGVLSVDFYVKGNVQNPYYVHLGASGAQPAGMVATATGFSFTLDPANPSSVGMKPHDPTLDTGLFMGFDPAAQSWQFWYTGLPNHSAGGYLVVHSSAQVSNLEVQNQIMAELPERPRLLMNTPTGYVEQGATRGLAGKVSCVSVVAADFDNDGDEDIYMACRSGVSNLPNRLFMNTSEQGGSAVGQFQEVTNHGAEGVQGFFITDQAGLADSVVTADYDLDGCVDLFVANGIPLNPFRHKSGPDQLFHNSCNYGNNWLEFDLQGLGNNGTNRDGVGAKVYVTTPDGKTQLREQNGGMHRWSQNHMRLHFGLGQNAQADEVRVVWPHGRTDTFRNVAPNHLYRAQETATALVQLH